MPVPPRTATTDRCDPRERQEIERPTDGASRVPRTIGQPAESEQCGLRIGEELMGLFVRQPGVGPSLFAFGTRSGEKMSEIVELRRSTPVGDDNGEFTPGLGLVPGQQARASQSESRFQQHRRDPYRTGEVGTRLFEREPPPLQRFRHVDVRRQ